MRTPSFSLVSAYKVHFYFWLSFLKMLNSFGSPRRSRKNGPIIVLEDLQPIGQILRMNDTSSLMPNSAQRNAAPANLFVATFIGHPGINLFPGQVDATGQVRIGELDLASPLAARALGQSVTVGIRPADIRLGEGPNSFSGQLRETEFTGADTILSLALADGNTFRVRTTERQHRAGATLKMSVASEDIHLFDEAGNRIEPMTANYDANPFDGINQDHAALWTMLVHDDIEAFIRCDWDAHARDFVASGFFGINAGSSADPAQWGAAFPSLDAYRSNWVGFAEASAGRSPPQVLREAHFKASRLNKIEINGTFAFCLKSFNGSVSFSDGTTERLFWETSYFCRKLDGKWHIAAFIGFMPGRTLAQVASS